MQSAGFSVIASGHNPMSEQTNRYEPVPGVRKKEFERQGRQCAYNITIRRVPLTIVAVGKQ